MVSKNTEKERDIVAHLTKIYDPIAIILAGSRASLSFVTGSDWDVYILTNESTTADFEEWEGETLDITLIKHPIDNDFILNTRFHPEQYLRILSDKSNGVAPLLVQRTLDSYRNGPAEFPEDEYRRLSKVMYRHIQKSSMRKDLPGLSYFYLSVFYELALRLFFQLQKQWPPSPHVALLHIKEVDNEFYSWLETIFEKRQIEDQLEAAHQIHARLFNK